MLVKSKNGKIIGFSEICIICGSNKVLVISTIKKSKINTCLKCYLQGNLVTNISFYSNSYLKSRNKTNYNLKFRLSKLQNEISSKISKSRSNILLYAVCGAGKTEIMYEYIKLNYNYGKLIAWVIPRKDIVIETYNKILNDFENINISMFHGDIKNNYSTQLIVTTVNQLKNFYKWFDCIIFDEFDAFPYSENDDLKKILKKSLKVDGQLIYVSATPTNDIEYEELYFLPIRYHGNILDTPKIVKVNNKYLDPISIISNNCSKTLITNRKLLIFVPTIKFGEEIYSIITDKISIFVNSKTNSKHNQINKFIHGEKRIMITTQILERGFTFKHTDVLVLAADHDNFTFKCLVQICGRVGRSADDTRGDIVFCVKRNLKRINACIEYIELFNKLRELQINEVSNMQEYNNIKARLLKFK